MRSTPLMDARLDCHLRHLPPLQTRLTTLAPPLLVTRVDPPQHDFLQRASYARPVNNCQGGHAQKSAVCPSNCPVLSSGDTQNKSFACKVCNEPRNRLPESETHFATPEQQDHARSPPADAQPTRWKNSLSNCAPSKPSSWPYCKSANRKIKTTS